MFQVYIIAVVVPPLTVTESVTTPALQREGLFGLLRLGCAATPSGFPVKSVIEVMHVPAPNVFVFTVIVTLIVNGGVPCKSYPPAALMVAAGEESKA
jgi:hypothetical protein